MDETYNSGDRIVRTEFDESKELGVVGLVFVRADGQKVKALLAREDCPKFIEKLTARYMAILD